MVVVRLGQQRVDLRLGVVAPRLEPALELLEERPPRGRSARDLRTA
jgi:hypothetical protein